MAAKSNLCITPATIKNLSSLEAIRIIKRKLNSSQQERFRASCFGKFFGVSADIKFSGQIVHQLLSRQVGHPSDDEMWFDIGGKRARFSQTEFALITGLKCGNYPSPTELDKTTQSTRLRDKYFGGREVINTISLKQQFLSCVDEEDTFRLSLVYFLQAVLLSRDRKTSIDQLWLSLVDDLGSFNKFPWGKVCYKRTLRSLVRKLNATLEHDVSKKPMVQRKHKIQSYSLSGFPYAFQMWAYEAIPLLASKFAKRKKKEKKKQKENLVPRMLCWESTESPTYKKLLHGKVFGVENLDVVETLRASEFEAEQDYMKDIMEFSHTPEERDEKSAYSAETMESYAPQQSEVDVGDDDDDERIADMSWARGNKTRKQGKRKAVTPFPLTKPSKEQKLVIIGETTSLDTTRETEAEETSELKEWPSNYQNKTAKTQALVHECLRGDNASLSNTNISRENEVKTSHVVADNKDGDDNTRPVQEVKEYGFNVNVDYPLPSNFFELVDAVLQRELDLDFLNDDRD